MGDNNLERQLFEDFYFVCTGVKKGAESFYKFGSKASKFGFKVGSYLLESAFISPTRAKRNYHHFLNEGIKDSVVKYDGAFTSLVPGAIVNGVILTDSGENWKEALAVMALANVFSGLYEIGISAYNRKRESEENPNLWKEWERKNSK